MSTDNIYELHVCHMLTLLLGNETTVTEEEVDFLQESLRVDKVLWPVEIALTLLSTAVSVVNTVVLTRRSMLCSSLNVLLVGLELSNIVLSVFQFVISVLKLSVGQYFPSPELVVLEAVAVVLTFSSAYFVNWLTVAIGSWRFVAVTWPLKASRRLGKRNALLTIATLVFVSLVPGAFFALLNELDTREVQVCFGNSTAEKSTATYYLLNSRAWTAVNYLLVDKIIVAINVVYYLLPCICFVFITSGLIWNICQHSVRQRSLREGQRGAYIEEGQTRTNIILIVMLSFFLASNTVPVVIRLIWLSGKSGNQNLFYFLTYVLSSYPLSLLTNALSFFAYYYMGTKFRDTFHEIFLK